MWASCVLLWASLVFGKRLIKTDALSQCQASTEFSAQKFEVTFYPSNNTANLDVELTSAIDGNFSVDVNLFVYGIHAFSTTISGCDISKTICPIEPGRFNVQTDFKVPDKYVKEVPGVAYTVPNIDAYVEARVYYVDADGNRKSNNTVACVVAQLSNDMTVQHQYVSWILFGIIIVGVAVSAATALGGNSRTASQIISNTVSLFTYFQGMAIIAMMAVYRSPPIAAAWAQNFMWTMGIFSVGFMQRACYWYVKSTGGNPTNILGNKDEISIAVYKKRSLADSDLHNSLSTISNAALDSMKSRFAKRVSVDLASNVTTTNEHDSNLSGKTLVLQGIKRVSYSSNIELSNFFLTGAASFVFIGIFLVIALSLVKSVLELLVKSNAMGPTRLLDYRMNYHGYTKGSSFRYFILGFTQLSLLCLWEFTDRASAATVVIAIVMFIILLSSLIVASVRVMMLGRRSRFMFKNPASISFGNPEVLSKWGFLYVQYKSSAYWFLFPFLSYIFARSATIASGQSSGKAQSIVLVVIEVIYFLISCFVRPYMSKSMNGYNIAISVFSVVNAVFFMFFSQLFGTKIDVASAIIGIVYFVMNAVVCFGYLVAMIVDCLLAIFHPHPDDRYEPVSDDRNLFMPDASDHATNTESNDLGASAKDGYRHSYMNYDPKFGSQGFGIVPNNDSLRSDSSREYPPNAYYADEDAPAAALQGSKDSSHSDSFNYRDQQSRGVVRGHSPEHYDPHDHLL